VGCWFARYKRRHKIENFLENSLLLPPGPRLVWGRNALSALGQRSNVALAIPHLWAAITMAMSNKSLGK
jgi:hypothetical protein